MTEILLDLLLPITLRLVSLDLLLVMVNLCLGQVLIQTLINLVWLWLILSMLNGDICLLINNLLLLRLKVGGLLVVILLLLTQILVT